jgi:hypothetical protein
MVPQESSEAGLNSRVHHQPSLSLSPRALLARHSVAVMKGCHSNNRSTPRRLHLLLVRTVRRRCFSAYLSSGSVIGIEHLCSTSALWWRLMRITLFSIEVRGLRVARAPIGGVMTCG